MSNKICWDSANKVCVDPSQMVSQSAAAMCSLASSVDPSSSFVCGDPIIYKRFLVGVLMKHRLESIIPVGVMEKELR